ncbi:MAG: hypothetical protein FWD06_06030 [Oscillospiraceae bacterium]|nr:hypothetical protein [Oscillospiraceae bacterium]
MKKIIALLLALLLLAGCASVAEPAVADVNPPEVEETTETTTTTEWTPLPTQPIDLPTSFPDAPEVYWPILRYLHMFADDHEGNIMYAMDALWFAGFGFATRGNNGFMIADINGDGIDELIVMGQFEGQDPHMIALFTQHNGVAVRLGSWTHRASAVLTVDGIIYDRASNSSESSVHTSAKLEPGATRLTTLSFHEHDFIDGQNVMRTSPDGEWQPSSEEEIQALWHNLINPPNPMPLTFIPIEQ